ncbi:hypothetical protein DFJ73DRAFT_794297, partial [Zopfochytrium polystomum]
MLQLLGRSRSKAKDDEASAAAATAAAAAAASASAQLPGVSNNNNATPLSSPSPAAAAAAVGEQQPQQEAAAAATATTTAASDVKDNEILLLCLFPVYARPAVPTTAATTTTSATTGTSTSTPTAANPNVGAASAAPSKDASSSEDATQPDTSDVAAPPAADDTAAPGASEPQKEVIAQEAPFEAQDPEPRAVDALSGDAASSPPPLPARGPALPPRDDVTTTTSATDDVAAGSWLIDVKGWALIERPSSFRRRLIIGLGKRFFGSSTDEDGANDSFEKRARHFLSRPLLSNSIRVFVEGVHSQEELMAVREDPDNPKQKHVEELDEMARDKPSCVVTVAPNGQFSGTITLPDGYIPKDAVSSSGGLPLVKLVAYKYTGAHAGCFAESAASIIFPEGLSIISDLDDTIKESDVHLGKRAALKTAFFGEHAAVPGMSDLYRLYQSKFAAFHYVSASPYQLLPSIVNFLNTNAFPVGSLELRDIWAGGNMSSRVYKQAAISEIMERFPRRKYILVGDAGEKDAQTFAWVHDKYPDRVIKIFIRDVTGLGPGGAKRDAVDERGAKQLSLVRDAVAVLPAGRWRLFETAEEILLDEEVKAFIKTLEASARDS